MGQLFTTLLLLTFNYFIETLSSLRLNKHFSRNCIFLKNFSMLKKFLKQNVLILLMLVNRLKSIYPRLPTGYAGIEELRLNAIKAK